MTKKEFFIQQAIIVTIILMCGIAIGMMIAVYSKLNTIYIPGILLLIMNIAIIAVRFTKLFKKYQTFIRDFDLMNKNCTEDEHSLSKNHLNKPDTGEDVKH